MQNEVLVVKIDARNRGIANLTALRDAKQASLDKLIQQMGEHEVGMSECDGASHGKERWLNWAESRLANMQFQREYCEREIDTTNASINRLRSEVNRFQREIDEDNAAKQREIKKALKVTIAAVEGRKVGKKPGRKYYKPGDHPNYRGRNRAEQKPAKQAKKDKGGKAQQGHKKGKGHQQAA